MKIKDLNNDEKPRERFISEGAHSLSSAQLLAILLRTGTRNCNVVDVARNLLIQAEGSLATLADMSLESMCRVSGVGPDKAVAVATAFEIGRRVALERREGCVSINSVDDAVKYIRSLFSSMDREEFWAVFLKRSRRVVSCERISEGGETFTDVNIKKVVRRALDHAASAVIVAHNHPSGNPMPSTADIKMTKQLRTALQTFELVLMDHIIIAEGGEYSFATD